MTDEPIPDGARIGHVHLRVSGLERSVRLYRDPNEWRREDGRPTFTRKPLDFGTRWPKYRKPPPSGAASPASLRAGPSPVRGRG